MTDAHDPNGEVVLESLVGLHTLHSIGTGHRTSPYIGEMHDIVCINLDGVLYEFEEDPSDGLRNSLASVRSVRTTAVVMAPIYPPLMVSVRHRTRGDFGAANALYAINERTDLVVLDIGTDNIADYYPRFVFHWNPEGWTPEWLKARGSGVIVQDHEGADWLVLDDFPSHAEAKQLYNSERQRNKRLFREDICIRLNKKTMRFEVHERVKKDRSHE